MRNLGWDFGSSNPVSASRDLCDLSPIISLNLFFVKETITQHWEWVVRGITPIARSYNSCLINEKQSISSTARPFQSLAETLFSQVF